MRLREWAARSAWWLRGTTPKTFAERLNKLRPDAKIESPLTNREKKAVFVQKVPQMKFGGGALARELSLLIECARVLTIDSERGDGGMRRICALCFLKAI